MIGRRLRLWVEIKRFIYVSFTLLKFGWMFYASRANSNALIIFGR